MEILAKKGGAEQYGDSIVTAMVTRALVNVVMVSDGLVGEAVGAWKNELCIGSLHTWFSVPDSSIKSCVV